MLHKGDSFLHTVHTFQIRLVLLCLTEARIHPPPLDRLEVCLEFRIVSM